eukprot:CAMPEP_0182423150 /NCGR_PEP_ID=MMETSP1167-20130531/9057_1 /TAXON_ID=2988 /ORGANISM="Mallomonas Sp, Strain CCMP3275" /LENGTH=718 /DNA_ID=CAMNT_0024601851 /DNA_START=91 /DNA_END=2247 /DNA_ORIENTATION=+
MSYTRVMESRPYDAHFDPIYTGPYNNVATDPRVAVAMSSAEVVSGPERSKYFKRPVMPRISAVPPHLLLAPTGKEDPMTVVEEEPEPAVKTVEVQTMYRESEAQTVPYTPSYFVQEGEEPEVLMLQGLTASNGLPVGPKEIEMIENARAKRDLESSLPPFTDEACLSLRKKLMEYSELKEYNLREKEIDSQREGRLLKLRRALDERDENNEFLASQRIEALRQNRMDEREKVVQQIRKKRVKILRRLARKRNNAEPVLSSSVSNDIINEYYDHGSATYAPMKRHGRDAVNDTSDFDITTRTAPLNTMGDITTLEAVIPRKYIANATAGSARNFSPVREMSKTAPAAAPGGGRVAKPRLTSSTLRIQRNTKRDVETMNTILTKKKLERQNTQALGEEAELDKRHSKSPKSTFKSRNRQSQGRPTTPDFSHIDEAPPENNTRLHLASLLLQRLIRGRAVQNSMYEGRYRRSELIAELRAADMNRKMVEEEDIETAQEDHIDKIKLTTVDAVAGTVTSNALLLLSGEQDRLNVFETMRQRARLAMVIRHEVEAKEAGRRQKENMAVGAGVTADGVHYEAHPTSDFVSSPKSPGDLSVQDGSPSKIPSLGTSPRLPTPQVLVEVLQTAAAEQTAVQTILEDLNAYPTLVEYFKDATTREHQEQISRDLVLALHSSGEMADKYASMDEEDKEALVQEVLERLVEHVGGDIFAKSEDEGSVMSI